MLRELEYAGFPAWLLFLILGIFLFTILFLLTLNRTLDAISPDCRKMRPGQVWLNLVPVFSLFWMFHTITSISESMRCEFSKRRQEEKGEAGTRRTGMLYALLNIVSLLIPGMAKVVVIVIALLCLLLYWSEINSYRKKIIELKQNPNARASQKKQ